MTLSILWLNKELAKVFHFSAEQMRRENLVPLYEEIVERLHPSDKILILGPDDTRIELHQRLLLHHPVIAGKVIGNEISDNPSDHDIAALALRTFQKPSGHRP